MSNFGQDLLYGLRLLRRSPVFTTVAALTLALGIGVNTALFSVVDWLLFRPLPVERPSEIVELAFQQRQGDIQSQFSVPDYRDIRSQTTAQFTGFAGYQIGLDGLSLQGKAERVMTYYVTGDFFATLGLRPALGRLILPAEGEVAGADRVLVLAFRYWQRRFDSDPGIVGTKVSLNGRPFTVVGVAPRGFHGPYPILEAQAYLPLGANVIEGTPPDFMENRGTRSLVVLGRLRQGVSLQQARAALAVVGQRLSQLYPATDEGLALQAYPELRSRPQPDPNDTLPLISGLFLGLAAIVLLLACLNVANLLLVRATIRGREMAMRTALGASRPRLIRQLLTESFMLAGLGGFGGLLLGYWGSSVLSSVNIQTDLPVFLDFSFDWRVFAYALGAALLTGFTVGIVPALRASRGNPNTILRQGGRSVTGAGARLRTALVMAELGGSLTLLIIAGLFTRSLQAAQRTDLGFDPSHVVNFCMDPGEIGYDAAQSFEFYRALLARVRSMPGVESATTASSVPMGYYGDGSGLIIEGYTPPPGQPRPSATFTVIGSDYGRTLRIPLLDGRDFTDADDRNAPYVAIVNRALARRYWPGESPVGRSFRLARDPGHPIRIVGVAADARYNRFTGPIPSHFYLPLAQHSDSASLQALQVRTFGDPASIIPQVEHLISAIAPDLPVFDVRTMRQALNGLNGMLRFQLGAALAAVLGMVGLVLSVVGVYGVISYSTSQRTQEIGIRVAMGARQIDIQWMVLRHGLVIVSGGLALGLACAFAGGRLVGRFLVISPTDPVAYLGVSFLLTVTALAACYIPARRITRVDPLVALRCQ